MHKNDGYAQVCMQLTTVSKQVVRNLALLSSQESNLQTTVGPEALNEDKASKKWLVSYDMFQK